VLQCTHEQPSAVVAHEAPAELAAVILPLFPSPRQAERWAIAGIVNWFRTGEYCVHRFPRSDDPDCVAIDEAMKVLEHARLLIRHLEVSDYSSFEVGLTRLGVHALQTNTVRQHLGLSDATPTD
jgi:hypothetical protein